MHKLYDDWPIGEIKDEWRATAKLKLIFPVQIENMRERVLEAKTEVDLKSDHADDLVQNYLTKEVGIGRTLNERIEIADSKEVWRRAKQQHKQLTEQLAALVAEHKEIQGLYAELTLRKQTNNFRTEQTAHQPKVCPTCERCYYTTHNVRNCNRDTDQYLKLPLVPPLITRSRSKESRANLANAAIDR